MKMGVGIKPLGSRVVIKKLEAEEKTQGGLILTSSAKEKPQVAEVVAVGPGTKDEEMELKEGDRVVFSKYAGTEVKYGGVEYTIMSQSDILAKVEK
jgi:chaperonin GroES